MSKPDPTNESEEADFHELFECLKQIQPPPESRVLNRQTVASEIARIAVRSPSSPPVPTPLWRRTVRIPMPVVAATVAGLLLLSVSHLRRSDRADGATPQAEPTIRTQDRSKNQETSTPFADVRSKTYKTAYRKSATYLCGVGTLRTETRYFAEESE